MSNIQTGAERMPHDLSHLGFLAGQIGRLITISTTPVIAGDYGEMDGVGAIRLAPLRSGLAIDSTVDSVTFYVFFFSSRRRHTICSRDWSSDVCSSDLVHPLAVRRIQGPGAVEFQPAARPDTRFLDLHGVKRLDRVQLNDGKPRRHRRGFHGQILAKLSGQEGPAEASLWKFNPRRETGPGPHAQERRRPARRSRSSAACRSENIRQSARI